MSARSASLRHLLLLLGALCALVPAAGATWSIVVVNRRTGEVCVASATCIVGIDLTRVTPVILVGRGAGVTQALLDAGENKVRIWDGILAGDTPAEIMARIRVEDAGSAARQIGIVDFENAPLSFTGRTAGQAKKSIAGTVDDLVYAIQGNVLVSQAVMDECEAVLRASTGDTGQRVLAAMVRARELGGDGRCSCGPGSLGDCGTPHPNFQKSAHCGYLLLARVGDADGNCAVSASCADGEYHLELNIRGANAAFGAPDPVDQMVALHAEWRAARVGRPDGVRSRVRAVDSLPADGVTERTIVLELADLDGASLGHGGAVIELVTADGAPPLAMPGPVVDHGDGTYSFTLRAGKGSGTDRFVIRASDDLVTATLYPYLEVRSDPADVLHAGRDEVSAAAPESVPFVVSEPTRPGAKFWLVTRLAGRKFRGPLLDPSSLRAVVPHVAPFFPAPPGLLDGRGRAEARYAVPPGVLVPLIGLRLEWTARIFGGGPPLDSNAVGFTIVP